MTRSVRDVAGGIEIEHQSAGIVRVARLSIPGMKL
jgi:hypothetical protein